MFQLPGGIFSAAVADAEIQPVAGEIDVLTICDQTLFGNSYKYDFADSNFNKNPMALNFYNTTSMTAAGVIGRCLHDAKPSWRTCSLHDESISVRDSTIVSRTSMTNGVCQSYLGESLARPSHWNKDESWLSGKWAASITAMRGAVPETRGRR